MPDDIKQPDPIETVVIKAKDGKFATHPCSMTPRTFIVFLGGPKVPSQYEWFSLPKTINGAEATVYELLTDGQCVVWPNLPAAKPGFDFWIITLKAGTLNDVSLVRNDPQPEAKPKPSQEALDALDAAGLKVNPETGNVEAK